MLLLFFFWISIFLKQPSLDRNWAQDQKVLVDISFSGSQVSIKNIRDFIYTDVDIYEENYKNETYNLDELESLYYIIEPFWKIDWPAHTMMSFGFKNWEYIVISAEIRKEIWESFSPLKWTLRNYEMMYVVWTERDLVQLRANHRKDEVFMYPIKSSTQSIKKLFISMLERADQLTKTPEFYNTIVNNCTTSIWHHVNDISPIKIPKTYKTFMPSRSDELIYDLDLIETNLSLWEAREYYKINSLSEKYAQSEQYSQLIRKERK